jgi:hypothetical protein
VAGESDNEPSGMVLDHTVVVWWIVGRVEAVEAERDEEK